MAAQTFIRWAAPGFLGAPARPSYEQLPALGIAFLDGTSVRAHQKAGGAARKGALKRNGTYVKRLAAHVAALEPRPA
jgi:hypothetical protein